MGLERLEQALDYQENYEKKVGQAVWDLKGQLKGKKPYFGIVLGSGLGDLASRIDVSTEIDYCNISNFPTPTVAGHEGKLLIGELEGVPVIGLKGRKHYYEVADKPFNTGILEVVFPVHVLAGLGVPNYFVTNAAGGLNTGYDVGDIMVIRSHINFIPNPLLGREHGFKRIDGEKTWRFQPMNNAYDSELRKMLLEAGESVHEGVYLALPGPAYETEAECITFRDGLKADAVGMSTAPEVIAARNRGMKCVGMSCITNKIAEDGTNATNHEEVKAILDSKPVRDRLCSAVERFFGLIKKRIS